VASLFSQSGLAFLTPLPLVPACPRVARRYGTGTGRATAGVDLTRRVPWGSDGAGR